MLCNKLLVRPFATAAAAIVFTIILMFSAFDNAAANCFDDFVANNPDATSMSGCCGGGLSLPDSVTTLKSLTGLGLSNCNLQGTLPAGLGELSNLRYIYTANSEHLGGTIPDISKLTQMVVLGMSNCQFTGPLPDLPTALTKLELQHNRLTSSLPAEYSTLSQLRHWDIRDNLLSGSLPAGLGTMSTLTSWYIQNNRLTGSIPTGIVTMRKLNLWDISDNLLTGSLATELGSMSTLAFWYINDNRLAGSLPSELGTMEALHYWYIHNNDLTGSIPTELTTLPDLDRIHMNNNRFHGGLPAFPITVDSPAASGDEPYYNYLAPGDDCSGEKEEQCSLAADACNYLDTCCSPGKECRRGRSCSTGTATCPNDEFNCDGAQFCVEGFCGDGPWGAKGMCCGSTGVDVGCISDLAESGDLSNWCMVCSAYTEFGLHDCQTPVALPAGRGLPTGVTHVVCESDVANQTTLFPGNFIADPNLKYLSLHGSELIGGSIGQLNDKFTGLTHLEVSNNINDFGSLILSSTEWQELQHLNVSGMNFGCAGQGTECFHSALENKAPELRVLDISNLGLTEARGISGVASIASLEELYINNNDMKALPDNFFNLLVKLTKLRIRRNDIPGTLPDFIYERALPLDCDVPKGSTIILTSAPTTDAPTTATPTTADPTKIPTQRPTGPTIEPTRSPTKLPTKLPTSQPTASQSTQATMSQPTPQPTKPHVPDVSSGPDASVKSSPPVAVIVGAAGGALTLIVSVAVAVVLVRKKKSEQKKHEATAATTTRTQMSLGEPIDSKEKSALPIATAVVIGRKSEEML